MLVMSIVLAACLSYGVRYDAAVAKRVANSRINQPPVSRVETAVDEAEGDYSAPVQPSVPPTECEVLHLPGTDTNILVPHPPRMLLNKLPDESDRPVVLTFLDIDIGSGECRITEAQFQVSGADEFMTVAKRNAENQYAMEEEKVSPFQFIAIEPNIVISEYIAIAMNTMGVYLVGFIYVNGRVLRVDFYSGDTRTFGNRGSWFREWCTDIIKENRPLGAQGGGDREY